MIKRILGLVMVLLAVTLFCGMAAAEAAAPVGGEGISGLPVEPFSWEQLATIAGATLATMLIVQLLKLPMDKVWKIPTRIIVYVIALVISLLATYFTSGLTWQSGILTAVNAVIVALAAMGGYEVTFKKIEDARKKPEAAEEE